MDTHHYMAFLYFTVQNSIQTFYDFSAIKGLVTSILNFFEDNDPAEPARWKE